MSADFQDVGKGKLSAHICGNLRPNLVGKEKYDYSFITWP